jgi:Flp pilus assembly protein TadG
VAESSEGTPLSRMLDVRSQLQELAADRRGVTAVVTAIALATLVGFCGLAVDVVMWEVNQRDLQGAADQAALAAATAFRNAGETGALGDSTTAQNAAYATAIRSGYPAASVTVAAYNNATTCTSDGCLEVTITQQQPQYFTALFLSSFTASASAVGTCSGCGNGSYDLASTGGGACVMALDPNGSGVITASGTPTLSLNGCNLQNNSPNTNATIMNGGATIEGCSTTNACGSQAFLAQPDTPSGNIDIPIVNNVAPAPDPYADVTPPSTSGCSGAPAFPSTSPVAPGTYASGPDHVTVTLSSGTFVFCNGWTPHGQTNVTGTGVTIYVLGGGTLNGNSTIGISAPTTGQYAGIAVWWGDSSGVTWDGTNSSTFSGAIYAPTATVTFGGTNATGATCTRLIAKEIDLHGTPSGSFDNAGCPAVSGPVQTASGVTGSSPYTGQPILVQ